MQILFPSIQQSVIIGALFADVMVAEENIKEQINILQSPSGCQG